LARYYRIRGRPPLPRNRVARRGHPAMRRHLRVARLRPEKVLIAFKRSSTAAVPQQHEEAFKADFDPSEASSVTGVFSAVT